MVAQRHGQSLRAEKGTRARAAMATIGGRRVALAVPTTYMNESGAAVRALAKRFGVTDPSAIVIAHDELDLPPGTVRLKAGGGPRRAQRAALHSVAPPLVRLPPRAHRRGKAAERSPGGVPRPAAPPKAVRAVLAAAVQTAADAIERIAVEGIDAAMLWCHSLPT